MLVRFNPVTAALDSERIGTAARAAAREAFTFERGESQGLLKLSAVACALAQAFGWKADGTGRDGSTLPALRTALKHGSGDSMVDALLSAKRPEKGGIVSSEYRAFNALEKAWGSIRSKVRESSFDPDKAAKARIASLLKPANDEGLSDFERSRYWDRVVSYARANGFEMIRLAETSAADETVADDATDDVA